MSEKEYLLGINQTELERLQFQHGVWKKVTGDFLDRLGIQKGWKCLDAGAGPGFVSMDILDRIGSSGEITLVERSGEYLAHFEQEAKSKGITNYRSVHSMIEDVVLPEKHYDLIFSRWVIDFVPDPERFLSHLIPALKPGGIIAIQDYYYEGLSLYPKGGAFDRMPDIARAYYKCGGGDAYTAGKIPAIFRKHGVKLTEYTPHVFAGDNKSDLIEWAHRFFVPHIPHMAEIGLITKPEADALVADWLAHRENPDTVFFSPMVVDMAGKA